MTEASRGILFFAHDNSAVSYGKLAVCSAILAKRKLGVPSALVTDRETADAISEHLGVFDHLILTERLPGNMRRYPGGVAAEFSNGNRVNAFDLSPFEETILMDSDYLCLDDSLAGLWGSKEDFHVNKIAHFLDHLPTNEKELRLDTVSVPMYWATVVYFRKTLRAQMVFGLMEHVRQNYSYYQALYGFRGGMYRNDYTLSIAIHTLAGFSENDEFKPLPVPWILTAAGGDRIIDAGDGWLKFLVRDRENGSYRISRVDGVNVHCMNKSSILENFEKITGVRW